MIESGWRYIEGETRLGCTGLRDVGAKVVHCPGGFGIPGLPEMATVELQA